MIVIQRTLSCGNVTQFASQLDVFGVGDDDVPAEQIKGFVKGLAHTRQVFGVKQICRVHHDLQTWGFQFVQQTTRFAC